MVSSDATTHPQNPAEYRKKARTSCLLLSACEDGEAEGGAASDDFCWKTENFRQRVRRGDKGGEAGVGRQSVAGGEDRETELIRGNERGFSGLQRETRYIPAHSCTEGTLSKKGGFAQV